MKQSLLDFLQSASNAVAGNVAGPVDLLGMGLNKIGVPVGAAPVGGTEWMKRQGLMRDVQQGPARVLGETAGLLGPALATQFAPQIAKGLLQAGDNLAAPARLNKEAGAIVWHGSPHKFDKFDSSKIGTGEGAQAYGHGLYLAENPKVAQEYQQALGAGRGNTDADTIARLLDSVGGNPAKAAAAARQRAQYANIPGGKEKLESIAQQIESGIDPRGALYKVDLPDEHIAKMLDYDAPLSNQAPIKQAWQRENSDWMGSFESGSGKDLLQMVRNRFDGNEADAADYLRKQGIPGIKYLDGGSRGAGTGTRNFVVFPKNEGLLQILERNGVPLAK